jgi:hypothetical protein
MGELKEKREKFTAGLARLIDFIEKSGCRCAIGPDGQTHMKESLHYSGLAADFAIYKDRKYLNKTEDYKFAGDYWKSLDPDFKWGGDFLFPDGNHFSIAYQGKA